MALTNLLLITTSIIITFTDLLVYVNQQPFWMFFSVHTHVLILTCVLVWAAAEEQGFYD